MITSYNKKNYGDEKNTYQDVLVCISVYDLQTFVLRLVLSLFTVFFTTFDFVKYKKTLKPFK